MPDDNTIRIKTVIDTTGMKAGGAEGQAIAAKTAQALKAEYASAVLAAKASLNELKEAQAGALGQFAAAGSKEAAEALGEYEQKAAAAAAEAARLKAQLEGLKNSSGGAAEGARSMGSQFQQARLAGAALTGSIGGIEMAAARLLLSSRSLQGVMAQLFPVVGAIAFIEVLDRVSQKAYELYQNLLGLKSFQEQEIENLKTTEKQREEQLKLNEQLRATGAIGAEGMRKVGIEQHNAAVSASEYQQALLKAEPELQHWIAFRDKLKETKAEEPLLTGVASKQLEEAIKNATEQVKIQQGHVDTLRSKWHELNVEAHKLGAEASAEKIRESFAQQRADIEATASFEEQTFRARMAEIEAVRTVKRAEKDETVADILDVQRREEEAARQYLADQQKKIEALKALALQEQAKTGKPAGPTVTALNTEEANAESRTQAQIVQIHARTDAEIIILLRGRQKAVEEVLKAVSHTEQEESRVNLENARRDLEERQRAIQEAARTEIETARDTAEEKIREMNSTRAHTFTLANEEVAIVEASERQQLEAVRREQDKLRELGRLDVAEQERLARQRVQIEKRATDQILEIRKQELKGFEKLTDEMNNQILRYLQGEQSMAKTLEGVWNQMAASFIKNLLKMGEQEIASLILHKAIARDSILVDAKTAAAHAFRWVMQTLPFPADVIVAPIAAAAVFAATIAFASFEQGGIVPASPIFARGGVVPINAHAGEMVLPAHISRWVQTAAGQGRGAGASGGHTMHVHYSPTINHPMTKSDIDAHADHLFMRMNQKMRQFNR